MSMENILTTQPCGMKKLKPPVVEIVRECCFVHFFYLKSWSFERLK